MTWSYAYRPRGNDPLTERRWPNRTVTLGNPATHSPDGARNAANQIKGQAAAGSDPAVEKKAKAAEDRRKRAATMGRLMEDYAKALPKRPKIRGAGAPSLAYVREEVAQLKLALAEMDGANLPAANVGEPDVRKLLFGGTAVARKRFGALSRFLDWCQDSGYIQSNPCALIARKCRPKAPQARSHFLPLSDLAVLWNAAEGLREPVWRDVVRFLIAVPCRRREATRMDWAHVDLSAGEWRQPSHMTKNNEPHRLHLHPLALDLAKARRHSLALAEANGDAAKAEAIIAAGQPKAGLIFPAPVSGKPVETFSRIKTGLDVTAKLTGWVWHDFRRSFASALGEAGISEAVADAMLNHRQAASRGGVLGVYQRSSRWPEQVKAMDLWGKLLRAVINGEQAVANVVLLNARGG